MGRRKMITPSDKKLSPNGNTVAIVAKDVDANLEQERMRLLASMIRIEITPDLLNFYEKWRTQLRRTFDNERDFKKWKEENSEPMIRNRKLAMDITYTTIINCENIRSMRA